MDDKFYQEDELDIDMPRSVAVSYTHLDVYKRQLLREEGEFRLYAEWEALEAIPVSYTHLDVYKRQSYTSQAAEIVFSQSGVSAEGSGVSVEGNTAVITNDGEYIVSGQSQDGRLIVDAEDCSVHIIFNGLTLECAKMCIRDRKEGVSGSIQNQKVILEKFAKDNKLPNPRFFYDDGFSGVTFTRPAFMEIMELAEQGLIGTIVVKDHSRLGRNRLVVGQLLEEDFVRLDIRYIAIMDNIDTAKGISDLVPMQDLFNEWHAKNTSDKVRKVMQSKGMSGKPLTTNPPFGYMKSPDNKDEWIVDEPAAKVVRKIFDLCVSGLGPTQIAKRLKAEKVLTPKMCIRDRSLGLCERWHRKGAATRKSRPADCFYYPHRRYWLRSQLLGRDFQSGNQRKNRFWLPRADSRPRCCRSGADENRPCEIHSLSGL